MIFNNQNRFTSAEAYEGYYGMNYYLHPYPFYCPMQFAPINPHLYSLPQNMKKTQIIPQNANGPNQLSKKGEQGGFGQECKKQKAIKLEQDLIIIQGDECKKEQQTKINGPKWTTIMKIMQKRAKKSQLSSVQQKQFYPVTEQEKKWLKFTFDFPPTTPEQKQYIMENIRNMNPYYVEMIKTIIKKFKRRIKYNMKIYILKRSIESYLKLPIANKNINLQRFEGKGGINHQYLKYIFSQPCFEKNFVDYAAQFSKTMEEKQEQKMEVIINILEKNRDCNISDLVERKLGSRNIPFSNEVKIKTAEFYLDYLKIYTQHPPQATEPLTEYIQSLRKSS